MHVLSAAATSSSALDHGNTMLTNDALGTTSCGIKNMTACSTASVTLLVAQGDMTDCKHDCNQHTYMCGDHYDNVLLLSVRARAAARFKWVGTTATFWLLTARRSQGPAALPAAEQHHRGWALCCSCSLLPHLVHHSIIACSPEALLLSR